MENLKPRIDFPVGDDKRRQETDHTASGDGYTESFFHAFHFYIKRFYCIHNVRTNHKSFTAYIFYNRKIPAADLITDIVAFAVYFIHKARRCQRFYNDASCGTGKRISREG